MAETHARWDPEGRSAAYAELEHPSDLFLEIRGHDLPRLFENALFAFYDQIAEIQGFEARRELALRVRAPGLEEALRSLLSEALFQFDTEGFVAAGGHVTVKGRAGDRPDPARDGASGQAQAAVGDWRVVARLWGDRAHRERHTLLHEVKAITYHRLEVRRTDTGWKATILLDL